MTKRRTVSRVGLGAALGLSLAIALVAAPALAQGANDKAAAEALFDEGKRLFLAKQFADACPRFEASQRLDPGIGTLLYLADCYEGQGRVASAWGEFREAAAAAKAAGQGDREQIARGRAALLEPKLFRVTLAVAAPDTPGLKVQRADADVKREVWGLAIPVDPGSYALRATAPGKKPWGGKLDVPQTPGERTVAIPALEDDPAAIVAPRVAPAPPPPAAPQSAWGAQRISGVVLGGAGVIGAVVGAIFAADAVSKNSAANQLCPSTKCGDQNGVNLSQQAGRSADIATASFVVGGIAAAGGLVLILTSPSGKQADHAWIAPVLGGGTAGLALGRTW